MCPEGSGLTVFFVPMTLPTGTITFLLTDIEGSTRLWDQEAHVMQMAVARHEEIITGIIELYGGRLPKAQGEGDSLLAVFAKPTDAVSAALDIQRELSDEPWQTSAPLRVRIALHTGEAELRGGDYYGQALNRCARLRAIAHGGQVLLSGTTYELVRDRPPAIASFADLGVHRLRDLALPERVFQLSHPDLPADFPPLLSIEELKHNLPTQLTSFIGRQSEITGVKTLLEGTRMLTLTGPGGLGKTRLALEVAAILIDAHPDGIWMIELESLADPDLLLPTVASELSVREEGGRNLLDTLADHLRTKRLLLILDNCEHMVEACAALAHRLLNSCRDLTILATSRESLGVAGETTLMVPPLSLPDPGTSSDLESLASFESVRLFVDRALSAKPDLTLARSDAAALASICRRLDGIPLAIELASTWVKVLSLSEIDSRITERLELLAGGTKTEVPRKQTIRASIDWSHDLLTEQEQRLLRRLSVFQGGLTLEAAEAICSGEGIADYEVLETLARLLDKSLILAEERASDIRYRLLEVVRQYAAEKLGGSREEEEELRSRHLDWFLLVAEESEQELEGQEQRLWYERIERDHDNFRAALDWTASADLSDEGLRLAAALYQFWFVRGYWTEGRRRLESALERCGDAPPLSRAKALLGAARLAHGQGEYQSAAPRYEEALDLQRAAGDRRGVGRTLSYMGNMAILEGDFVGAEPLLEESLTTLRELGDKRGLLTTLANLSSVAKNHGDFSRARDLLDEGLSIARELRSPHGIVVSLIFLGMLSLDHGDYTEARSRYEEGLSLARDLSDKSRIAFCLINLGTLAYQQGAYAEARTRIEEGVAIAREIQERHLIPWGLLPWGRLAEIEGDYEAARDRYDEARSIAIAVGHKWQTASTLAHSGNLARAEGRYEEARQLHEEGLAIARESGNPGTLAEALQGLADLAWAEGNIESAFSGFSKALELNIKRPDGLRVAGLLERLAAVAATRGEHLRAARLLGAGEAIRKSMGCPVPPDERPRYDEALDAIRSDLAPQAIEEAWKVGNAMKMEPAINEGLAEADRL